MPLPSPFYGPQRDYKNFPKMVQLDEPVKSRLCMFPESWFKFLYPKLGVTGMLQNLLNPQLKSCSVFISFLLISGPYTLGAGFILLLINKELYLVDDMEFRHTVAFFMWVYIFMRTPLANMLRDLIWSEESVRHELEFFDLTNLLSQMSLNLLK